MKKIKTERFKFLLNNPLSSLVKILKVNWEDLEKGWLLLSITHPDGKMLLVRSPFNTYEKVLNWGSKNKLEVASVEDMLVFCKTFPRIAEYLNAHEVAVFPTSLDVSVAKSESYELHYRIMMSSRTFLYKKYGKRNLAYLLFRNPGVRTFEI